MLSIPLILCGRQSRVERDENEVEEIPEVVAIGISRHPRTTGMHTTYLQPPWQSYRPQEEVLGVISYRVPTLAQQPECEHHKS